VGRTGEGADGDGPHSARGGTRPVAAAPRRARNDPRQYDDLVEHWERPGGAFAALHWLAAARAELIPPPMPDGEGVLLDVGCGGGLMAGHTAGYVHVGIDVTRTALVEARRRGLRAVKADAGRLPLADASASVVLAGEILEHVQDVAAVVAELCRVARPGATLVVDTINATQRARLALVTVAERLPGGPPPRIHDPDLFVPSERLVSLFADHGVALDIWGIRPSARDYARFLLDRDRPVRMLRTRSVALVYQGVGTKAAA
jgi:2-polyprenyl-6-hydroxyphenyl methylase/3-demethylubiquinone-9 3-methyltransferase